jgi:tetratricopeptide (TPR) repeat protein
MWMRNACISLLVGAVCLQAAVADDQVLNLLKTPREASSIGKYDDAERYHRLALDAARRSGEVSRIAEAAGDLGGILLLLGHYDEARRLSLESLGMFRRTGPSPSMLVVLNNLSALSSLRGDYPGAEKYLKDALELVESLDRRDPNRARLLTNLGSHTANFEADASSVSWTSGKAISLRARLSSEATENQFGLKLVETKHPNSAGARLGLRCRRWRLTRHGRITMSASIQLRDLQFPISHLKAAA